MINNKGSATGWIVFIIVVIIAIILYIVFTANITVNTGEVEEQETSSGVVNENVIRDAQLRLSNVSDTQPLSQGIIIVHDASVDFQFLDELVPLGFELLAEVGEPNIFFTEVEFEPGIVEAILIEDPIEPNATAFIPLPALPTDSNLVITVLQMAVASNDGYVFATTTLDGNVLGRPFTVENHDAGTEENSELLSGFEGGQPDPSRGEENIDNGVATDPLQPASIHPQLTEVLLEASIVQPEITELEGNQ